MSEHEELPLNSTVKRPYVRKDSGAQVRGTVAALDSSLGNLSREEIAHGGERAPRRPMGSGADMNLYVDAKYTSNKDYYYRFVLDTDKGRLQRAKDAYYDFVTDENGANITANSGNRKFYLMSLHKQFRAEDDVLKAKKYNAMINAKANEDLGVDGLETQSELKSRLTSDRYSSQAVTHSGGQQNRNLIRGMKLILLT